jgi:hypothetical protein
MSEWDLFEKLERDGLPRGGQAGMKKMLWLFDKNESSNVLVALADWMSPNGWNPYSELARLKRYPPPGWMPRVIADRLRPAIILRSEIDAARTAAEESPVPVVFENEEQMQLARELGMQLDGNAVAEPTLIEEYDHFLEYKFLDLKSGPEAMKTITERIKYQRDAMRFWHDMSQKGFPKLAQLVTPWLTRKCTSVDCEAFFSYLKLEDSDRRRCSSLRMLAARTLLCSSMQSVLDTRFGPGRLLSRRTLQESAAARLAEQKAAAASRGVARWGASGMAAYAALAP